ncbi:MAG: gfo/Idh/MocA family oxidoreductase [Calditrichaeota bacterium]|nr:MAG: gfo/Idh/MocA family oxidoreductase [Calditrichota bacterium]
MVRLGIVGLGYWGPNFERTFTNLQDSKIMAVCDLNEDRLRYAEGKIPGVFATQSVDDMLDKNSIDAVIISTPTKTHFEIAKKVLEAGLHVFVEKPLATSTQECQLLVDLAEKQRKILFVGHLFLYNTAVKKMKELVTSGDLGNICYINSQRLNLGPIRQDVNALWDLAPHDISIILDFIGRLPVSVNCQGLAYLSEDVHDVCTLTMHFEPKCMAIINVSWLDPSKSRLMTIVGEKKMATFNDMEPLEKIRVFNKRVEAPSYTDSFGEFQFSFQYGDTTTPWLNQVEPLKTECQHFLDCVQNKTNPLTDGQNGLQVVKVLEAAEISLHNHGKKVMLEDIKHFSPADANVFVEQFI